MGNRARTQCEREMRHARRQILARERRQIPADLIPSACRLKFSPAKRRWEMTDDFRLVCSVCGREPKTAALDLLDILRDPRVGTDREIDIFAGSEAFHTCDAPGCVCGVLCPEHTVLVAGKSFCPEHAPTIASAPAPNSS
jgi:hypothetical protein